MTVARIPGSVAVANGKGGTGKTSVAVNLAALSAAKGETTVAVDLDPQGNLSSDLGVESDEGRGLLTSAISGEEVRLLDTGRAGFSVIGGGEHTARLANFALLEGQGDPTHLADMLSTSLRPVADRGDRVWMDTPTAAGSALADAALMVCEWVLIPTRGDRGSLWGLVTMMRRMFALAEGGETIKPAGVVLFSADLRATRLNAQVKTELETELEGLVPVCETMIRQAEKACRDAREDSLTAAEYAAQAAASPAWYETLTQPGSNPATARSYARNAGLLADDYQRLADEVSEVMETGR